MQLITPRLKLRELNPRDYLSLREMECKPEFNAYEREIPTENETKRSLDESISSQTAILRTAYKFAITILPENVLKGVLKFSRQWEAIREWEIGWAVHPDEWGRGYATEAAWQVMNWAFSDLNIHRIVAYCHVDNAASVRVMEKLGMHLDGRLREVRWLRGEWWDELVYAILERDWKTL